MKQPFGLPRGLSAISVCLYCASAIYPSVMSGQSSPSILVGTDTNCSWTLDGVPQGALKTDDLKSITVSVGEHSLQAISMDGLSKYSETIEVTSSLQKMVKFALYANYPTWSDSSTALMWARSDNASGVTWQQAADYCHDLSLGGQTGWRLPTIDELQALTRPSPDDHNYRIKGGIRLSGFTWSANAGRSPGEAWVFYFVNATTYTHFMNDGEHGRALCVRDRNSMIAALPRQTQPLPSTITEALPPKPTPADQAAATLSHVAELMTHSFHYVHYFPGPAAPDDWKVKVEDEASVTSPCVLTIEQDTESEYDGALHNRHTTFTYNLRQTSPDNLHLVVVNETARPILYAITGVSGAKQLTIGPDEDLAHEVGSYIKGAASLCNAN